MLTVDTHIDRMRPALEAYTQLLAQRKPAAVIDLDEPEHELKVRIFFVTNLENFTPHCFDFFIFGEETFFSLFL